MTTLWPNADATHEHARACVSQLPTKKDTHSKTKMNQVGYYVLVEVRSSNHVPRANDTQPIDTILEYAQKALEDIRWKIDKQEFDEMTATKKECAPGPGGIPYGMHRCAGGLGSRFLFDVHKSVRQVYIVHPVQRCISSTQTTDNIFEVETTALAHMTCTARDSGILHILISITPGSPTFSKRQNCPCLSNISYV